MQIFETQSGLKDALEALRISGKSVGFVPTMGALHEGHLSLMEQSNSENDVTVVSIFVNPTQFNNPEDLKKYPRTLTADAQLIETLSGEFLVFAPSVEDMYPESTESENFDFGGLENQMEGSARPGHFDGVGTIVKRLFLIVKPDRAYFGEKDFQQVQIIKKLVEIENLPLEIVVCPISRQNNGLARSSRNQRLSEEMKEKAGVIYQTLIDAKTKIGTKSVKELHEFIESEFLKYPFLTLEYFEVADEATLIPAKEFESDKKYRMFIAVHAEGVRLIDTVSLN